MIARYRFFITTNFVTTEVFPNNFFAGKFKYTINENAKYYIFEYNGLLEFVGADFTYLYGIESSESVRCNGFVLNIKRRCNNEYVSFWQGKFSVSDGLWDLDKCMVTFQPKPNTNYNCLLFEKKSKHT